MALERLGRDVAVYGGADLLFRLAQFVALPIYAYHLSVADFGILALLTVSATLLGMLVNLGVSNAIQRFYFDPDTGEAERPLLVSSALAQLLLTGILIVGTSLLVLAAVSDEIESAYGIAWPLVLIALLTVLPEQIAQYCLDALRLQFAPLKFVAVALVKNLLGVLLGLWFLLGEGMGVAGLLLGPLLAAAGAAPLGLVMIRRDLVARIDPAAVRRVFHFGYPYVLAGAAYWVFGSMDRWMLIELADVEQVGLFSIAFKFATLLTFLIAAFGQAWSPIAYKMAAEEPRYREYFARILSLWFFALALVGLALALFAPEIMRLLTPRAYWPATPMLAIAAAGVVLYGTTLITAMGISLEKRTMLLSAAAWTAALANLAINLVLIPRFGGVGAAVATLLSYAVLTAMMLFWSQRLHPLPLEWGRLAFCGSIVGLSVAVAAVPPAQGTASIAVRLGLLALIAAAAVPAGLLNRALLRQLRAQLVRRGFAVAAPLESGNDGRGRDGGKMAAGESGIWRDELSGRYRPPPSYAEEFELQWKLALEGRPDYYEHSGVSLDDSQIADRVFEWTGRRPDGREASPGVMPLDRPVDPELIRGKQCIDVGCGMGRWTRVMQALGARSVLSVDLSDSALASVSRFNPNVLRADIMRLREEHPELVGRFDFANFWGVAMLTHDPRQAFMSAASTVRPGGAMFLMVYSPQGMGCLPEGARKRRKFHALATVEQKLAYVDHVHARRWESDAPIAENLKNLGRNLLGRPRQPKIGLLDMLEPYYTWGIPLPAIEGWMAAAGFARWELLNESASWKGSYEVLGHKA